MPGFQQEHGNIHEVPHLVRHAAVEQVAHKPVPVRGHGDQIHGVRLHKSDDLVRGLPHGQHAFHGEPLGPQLGGAAFQVGAVFLDLLALREMELFEVPGRPAVGDMEENQVRSGRPRQRLDVIEDGLVGRAVFDRDQDGSIYGGG